MITQSDSVSDNGVLEADLCIVGSGPAGLTLARQFEGRSARVILVESGGLEFDEATQSLCDGPEGAPEDPYALRLRQFCGTANLWGFDLGGGAKGVRLIELDAIDFEERGEIPYSGWPFRKGHLDPFYRRAEDLLRLRSFDLDGWVDAERRPLDFRGGRVATAMAQFGPSDVFLRDIPAQLEASENVSVILNANAVEVEANEEASLATHVRCATLGGKQFRVKARAFVLATGGIENARLLLLSNRSLAAGLGNQHDLVGRYFFDHYGLHAGFLFPADRTIFERTALYDMTEFNGIVGMGYLALTPETLRREGLLNAATYLLPCHRTFHWHRRGAYSKRYLKARLRSRPIARQPARPRGIPANLLGFTLGYLMYAPHKLYRKLVVRRPLPLSLSTGWSRRPHKAQDFASFELCHLLEQAPHPDNRVILSEERDRLGCPKAEVRCRLTELDIASIRRTEGILRDEFARCGLGRLVIDDDLTTPDLSSIDHGAAHHMGTTRMHDDPRRGVVDANCRVHGMANLYIAGSSVFPTGGFANPSLTIIALALRLSDHLDLVLGRSGHPVVSRA